MRTILTLVLLLMWAAAASAQGRENLPENSIHARKGAGAGPGGGSEEDPDLARRAYRRFAGTSDSRTLEWRVREFLPKKVPAVSLPNRRALEAYLAEAGEKEAAKIEKVSDFSLLNEIASTR